MQLVTESIRDRLRPLPLGIPDDYLERVRKNNIPKLLENSLRAGHIIIDPFPSPEELDMRIGPATIDFPLGNEIEIPKIPLEVAMIDGRKVIRRYTFDERHGNNHRLIENLKGTRPCVSPSFIRLTLENDETFELASGTILVGYTREVLCLPNDLVAHVNGKSRHARHGLKTHMTAPRFDPGFIGHAALEISTESSTENVNIYPGMIIAAFEFTTTVQPTEFPYYRKRNAQYSGQR